MMDEKEIMEIVNSIIKNKSVEIHDGDNGLYFSILNNKGTRTGYTLNQLIEYVKKSYDKK